MCMYWTNLFGLFTGFPPSKSGNFYADFYLFNQMFLSEGGHFYVDMHFYATFFACHGQKWPFSCYYALLRDIFYLRGPQRRRKKRHFYVNFYFIQ